jgi:hypothetical protein
MATAILGLNTNSVGDKLSAVQYNKGLYAEDRLARVIGYQNNAGVIAGLQLTVNKSTVTSGQCLVGPFYVSFTGSQVISGLTAGVAARRYIYARADGGSPASGTFDIVARTTSAALLNPDGITYAARLGYVVMSTNKVSGVYNSGNANFPRSKPLTISANKTVLPGGAKLYTSGTAASLVVTPGSFRALGGVIHLSTDTYLARSGANTLVTSDPLRIGGSLHLTTSASVAGSGAKTVKWRGNLKISGNETVGGSLYLANTNTRFVNNAGDIDVYTSAAKTLELQTPVWDDINLGGATLPANPGASPGRVEFKTSGGVDMGILTLALDTGEKVDGAFEMSHKYAEGTNFTPHLHWQGIAAVGGASDRARFVMTYALARDGALVVAPVSTVASSLFTTRYAFARTEFPAIVGTTVKIGDQFLFNLKRTSAGTDNYAGEALLATVGIHYQVNTMGSRTMIAK